MNLHFAIAQGVPPGLLFFMAFVGLWVVGAIFGKAKSTPVVPIAPRRGPGIGVPAPMNRPQQQQRPDATRIAVAPPPMPQKGRARAKPKPKPVLVPVREAAQLARQAAAAVPRPTAAKPPQASLQAQRPPASSETARNLRLMLQRGGVREAVLLAEVLGPPKSMRE